MKIAEHTYPVSEIFESIQGEGNYSGVNSLFVRFQMCNLTCSWCDTKYTWPYKNEKFKTYSEERLIERLIHTQRHHIIFTGGEPSLYRLDRLNIPDKKIHVESNGTIIPTRPLSYTNNENVIVSRDAMNEEIISKYNWVISPKLANSKQQIDEYSLVFWASKPYATFKFVVQNEADIKEVESLTNLLGIKMERVYLSIEGTSRESQLNTDLVDKIAKSGFNYSPRLQSLFWGSERKK